jgi:hypothetical protein
MVKITLYAADLGGWECVIACKERKSEAEILRLMRRTIDERRLYDRLPFLDAFAKDWLAAQADMTVRTVYLFD